MSEHAGGSHFLYENYVGLVGLYGNLDLRVFRQVAAALMLQKLTFRYFGPSSEFVNRDQLLLGRNNHNSISYHSTKSSPVPTSVQE
jgi:hypothetical protein